MGLAVSRGLCHCQPQPKRTCRKRGAGFPRVLYLVITCSPCCPFRKEARGERENGGLDFPTRQPEHCPITFEVPAWVIYSVIGSGRKKTQYRKTFFVFFYGTPPTHHHRKERVCLSPGCHVRVRALLFITRDMRNPEFAPSQS